MLWERLSKFAVIAGLVMVGTPFVLLLPFFILAQMEFRPAEAAATVLALFLYHGTITSVGGGLILLGVGLAGAIARALWLLFVAGSDAQH